MLMRSPTSWARPKLVRPPGFILPCQPVLATKVPVGEGWLHELKHDGFRAELPDAHRGSRHSPPLMDRLAALEPFGRSREAPGRAFRVWATKQRPTPESPRSLKSGALAGRPI